MKRTTGGRCSLPFRLEREARVEIVNCIAVLDRETDLATDILHRVLVGKDDSGDQR